MPRLRRRVILAWIFGALISLSSLINAGLILVHLLSGGDFAGLGDILFALIPLFFALPAALIITRQPLNPIGWLLMINPLVTTPSDAASLYLSRYQAAPPPATFLNVFLIWFTGMSWMALIFPIILVPLFFPTGRLISPRWRWTVYLVTGMTLFLMAFSAFTRTITVDFASWAIPNPIGFLPAESDAVILGPWSLLLVVITVASLASVAVRYRRGSLVEREQMKWLLYAVALFGLVYIPGVLANTNTSAWNVSSLINFLLPLAIMAIPAAITVAILRYHLFDIDVIIRLTLVYVILTGLLGLIYFGGIILLQQGFRVLTGQTADFAVVITTLAIAALFTPLRRRIQAIIDRRFFRQKYSAEQALAEFAVATRGSADLDALTGMLVDITQETLHPAQVNLQLLKK